MEYKNLILQIEDHVGTLTLNRPDQRNAMTRELGEEIAEAVKEIKANPDIWVLIITGAGKAFSAGGDLGVLKRSQELSPYENRSFIRDFYPLFLSILKLDVPTIAAINGPAIGAGLCFALACDIRYIAEEAQVGVNFTRLGIHPGMGGTYFLPRIIGWERASELFFTGKLIKGKEAKEIGLASAVYPATELLNRTRELAQEIAKSGPIAVKMVKKALQYSLHNTLEAQLEYESYCQGVTFTTEDFKEGIKSVLEKRTPSFIGR
jgi:enoyl-CoA hydratase/carnithine racemase